MNKTKLNLVGGGFSHKTGGHTGYSVYGKISKNVEWVFDNSVGITFYINDDINRAFSDNISGIKYGWLLECTDIKPHIHQQVKNNYQRYFEVFKYIFTHSQELLNLDDRFKWCPTGGFWIKKPKIYEKSKMISMISSNKSTIAGHRTRLEWVNKIGNQVDLYGRGFKEIKLKEEGLCDYMFSVAIENAYNNGYFTEKILDCFATGTIPVYLGAPNIGDYFNMDGIITLSEEFYISEDLYYEKMDAIKDNLEKIKQFEVLEDFITNNYDVI